MSGFDDLGVFFSDNFGSEAQSEDGQIQFQAVKRKFKDFFRQFHEGNFEYRYRDQLKRNCNLHQFWCEVSIDDVSNFDETLADKLLKEPMEYMSLFEEAAKEVADEVTRPRPADDVDEISDVQVMLKSDAHCTFLRNLKSENIAKLVKVSGIIIAASGIKAKATKISIQCRSCRTVLPNISIKPGLEGYTLPRKCNSSQTGRPSCPIDPYFIMPDKCKCVDYQILKLQENPEDVPNSEIPRHMQLYCDRYLCEKIVPGNRVTLIGIYSIKKITRTTTKKNEKGLSGIRSPYIRVLGIQVNVEGPGRVSGSLITHDEEEQFKVIARSPDIYERVAKSIAPSIYGSIDIKKAIAALLFGGSRKRMPDGLTRRGDINLLLLGDPGTAKSQLLKFVERVSPIGVYTSGKGSSAAGLTASVIKDPASRTFVIEGGAMVLADGGVVCIDEFDKMKQDDRVAIHEAMEQQTISIAKAGITTTLNTRCSVLAAANSVFGRWDDTKGEENIDFMPTILSRFDMIFLVKDQHNETRDIVMAKHVMNVHLNALKTDEELQEGELGLEFLKKFISYARLNCGPRLSLEAAEKLKNNYVNLRNGSKNHEKEAGKQMIIPITVRQLEAVIRISESLAKMQLIPFVTEVHVDEALRLFQASTLDAAMSGSLAGAEGFTTQEDHEIILRIEKQIKRRFAIGSQVSEHSIIQDFVKQKYPEQAVHKVLYFMIRRGEVQHRMQRKMLIRVK